MYFTYLCRFSPVIVVVMLQIISMIVVTIKHRRYKKYTVPCFGIAVVNEVGSLVCDKELSIAWSRKQALYNGETINLFVNPLNHNEYIEYKTSSQMEADKLVYKGLILCAIILFAFILLTMQMKVYYWIVVSFFTIIFYFEIILPCSMYISKSLRCNYLVDGKLVDVLIEHKEVTGDIIDSNEYAYYTPVFEVEVDGQRKLLCDRFLGTWDKPHIGEVVKLAIYKDNINEFICKTGQFAGTFKEAVIKVVTTIASISVVSIIITVIL